MRSAACFAFASLFAATLAATLAATAIAQPPGITMDMINTVLPEEGAPLAEAGAYAVMSETAFNSAGHRLYRPSDLAAFPAQDKLPVLVWGNGGCAIDNPRYGDFLGTIASHGFLVLTTAAKAGETGRAVLTVRNPDSPFWVGNLRNSEFRCLVPATAFMEWGRADPQSARR